MEMKRVEEKDNLKKSLLLKWGVQYLSLTLVPFVIFICFASYSSSLLFNSIKKLNKTSLSSVSREIDSILDSTNSLAEDIILSQSISSIRYRADDERIPSQDLYTASTNLRHLMNSYSMLTDCMIFSPGTDLYVSTMRWGTIEEIFLRDEFSLLFSEEISQDIFMEDANRIRIYDASYNQWNGIRIERILIIRPLSFVQYGAENGYYLAAIANVKDLLSSDLSDFNDFMIVQKDTGRVLFDYSASYCSGDILEDAPLHDQNSAFVLGNDIASVGSSEYSSFMYVILTDRADYNRYRNLMVVSAASLLLISMLVTAFLIYRHTVNEWNNYKSAMNAIGSEFDNSAIEENPYAPFMHSAERMKAEKELMGTVIETQTKKLKESILLKLVDTDSAPVSAEALEECGIHFISDKFTVLLISLSSDENRDEIEAEIIALMSSDKCQTIPFPSAHGIAVLLSVIPDSSFDRILASNVKELMEKHKEVARAAASDVSEGLKSVGSDYLDAINVLEYESEIDSREFMVYRDIVDVFKKVGFVYTTEDEIMLQQAIEEGRELEAKNLLSAFIEKNRENSSPRTLRYLLFSIMGTIIRSSSRIEQAYGWEMPEISISSIIQSDNFSASFEEVSSVLESIVRIVVEKKSENENYKEESYIAYKKALNIIQNEFSDSMLNVSEVAEKIGVSNVYLSKIFKRYHGSNISDYIAQYRIMVAKKYLSQDKPIKDIVEECGFGSLRTFLRQFKDKENITPGQFRAMRKERSDEEV